MITFTNTLSGFLHNCCRRTNTFIISYNLRLLNTLTSSGLRVFILSMRTFAPSIQLVQDSCFIKTDTFLRLRMHSRSQRTMTLFFLRIPNLWRVTSHTLLSLLIWFLLITDTYCIATIHHHIFRTAITVSCIIVEVLMFTTSRFTSLTYLIVLFVFWAPKTLEGRFVKIRSFRAFHTRITRKGRFPPSILMRALDAFFVCFILELISSITLNTGIVKAIKAICTVVGTE